MRFVNILPIGCALCTKGERTLLIYSARTRNAGRFFVAIRRKKKLLYQREDSLSQPLSVKFTRACGRVVLRGCAQIAPSFICTFNGRVEEFRSVVRASMGGWRESKQGTAAVCGLCVCTGEQRATAAHSEKPVSTDKGTPASTCVGACVHCQQT